MPDIRDLYTLVKLLLADRKRLALENVALRHQLVVLKRSVNRPRIQDSDRIFWILLLRMLKDWKEAVHFVKPATIVKWHRKGFKYYWKRKSKSKPGRPPISMQHEIRSAGMDWVSSLPLCQLLALAFEQQLESRFDHVMK